MKPKKPTDVFNRWVATQLPINPWSDSWQRIREERQMAKAFKRGIKYARTGK